MTARDLAAELEVSERTIYRDIEALSIAGIPIYAQSGMNGGIALDEGYRVSLTGLSRAEVLALFVASEAGPLRDLGLDKAEASTLLKLSAALPDVHRPEVARLRQRFFIDPANWFQVVEPLPYFAELQQAVWEDRYIEMTYQPVMGEAYRRTIAAYGLVAKANIWYLIGRKPDGEWRSYRAGRLSAVRVLEDHFSRDTSFDLEHYWQESSRYFEAHSRDQLPRCVAQLRVHSTAFWYFPGYLEGRYTVIAPADAAGWMQIEAQFEDHGEALMRVMGWGSRIEVVGPPELRHLVIETAQTIVRSYTEGFGNTIPTPLRFRSASVDGDEGLQ